MSCIQSNWKGVALFSSILKSGMEMKSLLTERIEERSAALSFSSSSEEYTSFSTFSSSELSAKALLNTITRLKVGAVVKWRGRSPCPPPTLSEDTPSNLAPASSCESLHCTRLCSAWVAEVLWQLPITPLIFTPCGSLLKGLNRHFRPLTNHSRLDDSYLRQ